mmetsp:Transcript_5387/g.10305  ORF Transcript_5387/g.10305 Transcript_5387/m.10305 type:complete len:212 (-) Transcript_5387:333-968(-)
MPVVRLGRVPLTRVGCVRDRPAQRRQCRGVVWTDRERHRHDHHGVADPRELAVVADRARRLLLRVLARRHIRAVLVLDLESVGLVDAFQMDNGGVTLFGPHVACIVGGGPWEHIGLEVGVHLSHGHFDCDGHADGVASVDRVLQALHAGLDVSNYQERGEVGGVGRHDDDEEELEPEAEHLAGERAGAEGRRPRHEREHADVERFPDSPQV